MWSLRNTPSTFVGYGAFRRLHAPYFLLDVPAEIIALLYEYRWTIEIFFRQFKHLLGCRHLLSHNENGIKIPDSTGLQV